MARDPGEAAGTSMHSRLIEAAAFVSANSRAYLSAVLRAYREGQVVLALPASGAIRTVPGIRVVDRQSFEDAAGWFDEGIVLNRSDAPAQILLSSGTTGRPKPLLLSHRALSDVVDRINAAMEVDDSIREYVGVPVTFSFGFGRVRAVAAAGGRSYLPPHGFDPTEVARMLKAGEINAISAVPTLWRVVLANPGIIEDAGVRVRWIEIGSQYMSGEEKAALKRYFPNARIVQHYGLTEASRTTLLDISATEGAALESVGRATGRVEITIAEEGVIRIRGPHLADGLVTGSGVKPIADADGWLTTSDRGRIEDGFLYYQGRTDELINSGGIKIDPTQFEQLLDRALAVPGGIAVGRMADHLRGERVLVALDRNSGLDRQTVEHAAVKVAAEYGLIGAGSVVVREVGEIPRTATGKVQRKALADLPEVTRREVTSGALAAALMVADPAAAKAADLQRIWSEVLGVQEVSLHESFYDLGGDSLSALTVIMRMETLGLAPETARGIFDGKSISEITGYESRKALSPTAVPTTASAALMEPAADASDPAVAKAAELQRIWADVLGVREVSLHESFYDLGGDSLSALTVIMRMEALGLDPDSARGIFDGKSIAELTGLRPTVHETVVPLHAPPATTGLNITSPDSLAASAAIASAALPPGLTLAESINAVHATRGVLVLWVVVVHWLPGVLARLPGNVEWVYDAIEPLLRFGTPGFAIVFGIGIGALGIPRYLRSRELYLKGTRFNFWLIFGGVLLLALFKFGAILTKGTIESPHLLSWLFYSAIAYYALAMLMLPWIMRLLTMWPQILMTIFAVMVGAFVIHEVLFNTIAQYEPGGILQLIKILLTAKYGFFKMTVYVMVGVALGYTFRAHHSHSGLIRILTINGLSLLTLGAVVTYEAEAPGEFFSNFGQVQPWHLTIYAGVGVLFLAGFCSLNREGGKRSPRALVLLNTFAIASGILALPIFVGHALVIPAKDMLAYIGLPETPALVIPLGSFLALLAFAYIRLIRFLVR